MENLCVWLLWCNAIAVTELVFALPGNQTKTDHPQDDIGVIVYMLFETRIRQLQKHG